MGWSKSEFFTDVCRIATKYAATYPDRISTLIALVERFEDEDLDTIYECFDDVEDLKVAYFLCHPEEKDDQEDL